MARKVVPWLERAPRQIENYYKEMDGLMGNFFGICDSRMSSGDGFSPRINVAETETDYVVTMDLPGVDPNDVTVEMTDGQLLMSGERKTEIEEKVKTFHRVERKSGQFRRVVAVALPVDEEKVDASYRDGVLSVTLPKTEKAVPTRIEVKTVD